MCPIVLKGCILLRHASVVNVIKKGPNVYIMICLLFIHEAEKKGDYIAVVLLKAKCIKEVLGLKIIENGTHFDADRPVSGDEFMLSWEVINSNHIEKNNAVAQAAIGEKKKTALRRRKTKDAAAYMAGLEVAATTMDVGTEVQPIDVGESSKPKRSRGKKVTPREPTTTPKSLFTRLMRPYNIEISSQLR